MRAILINPLTQTITEEEFNGDYRHIYKLIGAWVFQTVSIIDENHHTIFIDEDGLFVPDQRYFKWEDYDQPLAGCGLILGTNHDGDSVAATMTIEHVTKKVTWPDIEYAGDSPIGGQIVHELFGVMTVVGSSAVFRKRGG